MSIPFDGFCGPSYQLDNKYAAVERLVNWYLAPNESAEEKKYKLALAPPPGNQAFGPLPVPVPFNQPNRGLLEYRGEAYGVNGTIVFSITQAGNLQNLGTIASDGNPVSMAANGNGQIFIASAGQGYVLPTGTGGPLVSLGPLGVPGSSFLGASFATFQDGYVIVVTPNSNQFQISGTDEVPLGDATQWDASNVSVQAGQEDNLRAVYSHAEYLWLMGFRRSQIYYDAGNQGIGAFPFQSYNETFVETGLAAPFSLADTEEPAGLLWLGSDKRGRRAWMARGFIPARISNFAVEKQWNKYVKISDSVGFTFIWDGHSLWQITFPSAFLNQPANFPLGAAPTYTSATWLYDVTASQLLGRPIWFERSYQTAQGYSIGRSELFHCFAYGKHLVGSSGADGNPGAIYQYGLQGTASQNPNWLLRWSNDGGNTYTPEVPLQLSAAGQYAQRLYYTRLGYARDRVYWLRYAGETECGTDINGNQVQQPLVQDRICPHMWEGNKRIIYNRIEFEVSRGLASLDGVNPNPFTLGVVGAELDMVVCSA